MEAQTVSATKTHPKPHIQEGSYSVAICSVLFVLLLSNSSFDEPSKKKKKKKTENKLKASAEKKNSRSLPKGQMLSVQHFHFLRLRTFLTTDW